MNSLPRKPAASPNAVSIIENYAAIPQNGEANIQLITRPLSETRRPLSEILTSLKRQFPESAISTRMEDECAIVYIPWQVVIHTMNVLAPDWSGKVRSITYSADGKWVSVIYRVTVYGSDDQTYRESTGTAAVDQPTTHGDPVRKAEISALRRACASFGLGLDHYHDDMM